MKNTALRKKTSPDDSLRYSISDEMLYGTVSNIPFSMKAFSGGGRGSTQGMAQTDLAHWSTRKKAPAKFSQRDRGGPLPTGAYIVSYYGQHDHLGRCAILHQTISSIIHLDFTSSAGISVTDRDGFYIHGEGPKGSDGCIVPAIKEDLKKLLDAIKSAKKPFLLVVHSEGIRSDKFNSPALSQNIA